MKAQELRIGNFLVFSNGIQFDTVVKVNRRFFSSACVEGGDENFTVSQYYKPILLTEQWLVMFGAIVYELDNGTNSPNQYRIGERLYVIREGSIVDYGCSVVIKYVHQLQNLYFALTGEELTLTK